MNFSGKRTALALSLLLIVSGCSATERLTRATTTKGQTEADVYLRRFPRICASKKPHASVVEGQPLIAIFARERQILDRANARQGRTVQFYDDITARYALPKRTN